jgi:hypothetical protein
MMFIQVYHWLQGRASSVENEVGREVEREGEKNSTWDQLPGRSRPCRVMAIGLHDTDDTEKTH